MTTLDNKYGFVNGGGGDQNSILCTGTILHESESQQHLDHLNRRSNSLIV